MYSSPVVQSGRGRSAASSTWNVWLASGTPYGMLRQAGLAGPGMGTAAVTQQGSLLSRPVLSAGRWVIMTPSGDPVDRDVWITYARSSGPTPGAGRVSGTGPVSASTAMTWQAGGQPA